ncbi:MAG: hypothetical protein J6Q65_02070, partial [Lentisphaeria bacterium]|nr:hypothetical protein [Lentisphaeria bacterium]
ASNLPPSGSWDYQMRMLAQMGQVNAETVEIISSMLGKADLVLQDLLTDSIYEAIDKVEPELRKAAEKGLLAYDKPIKPKMSANQTQAFKAYYQQSADRLNLVNTVMLESTQKAYLATVADIANRMELTQGFLNVAAGEVVAGVSSLNQAVSAGVQKMVDTGITGFIDHGGHHWTPEAYVTMDIRTTLANTGRAAVTEQMQEFGCDLFSVSWHDGARPLCYLWQGEVISESGWRGTVQDLDGNEIRVYALEDTTYGEPAGLFGINCGHYKIPFIPGYSVVRKPEQNKEENDKEYQESQQQRALERKLREEKRDLNVLKAQGAPEDEIRAQRQRVADARTNLDQFCTDTGRARRSSRERTPTDAKWPAQGQTSGQVRRFNGQYVQTDQPLHVRQVQPAQPAQPIQPVQPAAPVTAPATPATGQSWITFPDTPATADIVTDRLAKTGIQTLDLQPWSHQPTESEIIKAIAGGDQTSGSCASVALAYAGNKGGYAVHDFRGGASMDFFATKANTSAIAQIPGIDGKIINSPKEIETANKLLAMMEKGKEYFLGVGRHASIVRLGDTGYEYLELQSPYSNGWFTLNDSMLKYRFGCVKKRSVSLDSRLIEVGKLIKSPDFKEALRYINTAVSQQKKGVSGAIR